MVRVGPGGWYVTSALVMGVELEFGDVFGYPYCPTIKQHHIHVLVYKLAKSDNRRAIQNK